MAKTRDMLIDVARQLFAKVGVESTTMNDIAVASNKGRRTLYTYFKSKTDIYDAVVENELEILIDSLRQIAKCTMPAEEKLILFVTSRLDLIRNTVLRNGTLRAEFFRDIWRVEHVRKDIEGEEIGMLKTILDQGVKEGVFNISDTQTSAAILHFSLKGIDVPYIRGTLSPTKSRIELKEYLQQFILNGIKTL